MEKINRYFNYKLKLVFLPVSSVLQHNVSAMRAIDVFKFDWVYTKNKIVGNPLE